MKEKYILFVFLCFSVLSYGQTTIYQENFTGQLGKGASGSTPTINLAGVTWTINTASGSFSNNYSFNVVDLNGNELFLARNVGSSTWLTPIISIATFTNVGFTIDASQTGNLDNADTVITQYRINGGTWLNATTNGSLSGNYGNVTINQTLLSGNTLQLRVILANNSNGERQYIDNINVTGTPQPITYTYNNGWSPGNPSGVSLIQDDIIIQTGNASISANTTCKNFTVRPGASLTVNSGFNLTTDLGLKLESTSITYASLILNGSITGTVNYDRHVNINGSGTTGSNDLISAPLTGQAFNNFATANSNILSNTGNTLYLFGPFDKPTGSFVTYANTTTATLNPGIGYRAASNNNSTFRFTGTANTGIITNNIANSGPSYQEWNLVGNPYPSYINVQAFLTHVTNSNLAGIRNIDLFHSASAAIYGYDGATSDGWTMYNLSNTTALTLIAPGQGFFVSADAANALLYDLEFTPAMRSTGTSDDFIPLRNAELVYLKLNASTTDKSYHTEFYFNPNASLGMDFGYDAKIWGTNAPSFALYSNLVEDNSGDAIALQALNSTNLSDVSIALGVNANQGEQLRFSILESTLPETVDVYLDDTVANTSTLLNASDYVLTPNTNLSGTGRFFLRYSEEALSTVENSFNNLNIYSSKATKEIVVAGQLLENTIFNIYDIQGRLVSVTELNHTTLENRIDVSTVSKGIYIINLQSGNSEKNQKLVIE